MARPVRVRCSRQIGTGLYCSSDRVPDARETNVLEQIVHRIVLKSDGFELSINLATIVVHDDEILLEKTISARFKKRGVELRLIIGAAESNLASIDRGLIKTIAKARRWANEILTGKASSLTEIAKNEGLAFQYVSRTLPLAFLAPDLVEAILEGKQPADISAKSLMVRTEIPVVWADQRERLGF